MRKRKPEGQRVINAGISLPPAFIEEIRGAARMEGFETLTTLARYLLTQWLQQTHDKWETQEIERERRLKETPPARRRGRPPKDRL
jgi:hypothetical protein